MNGILVEDLGFINGDSLSSKSVLATSVPVDGLEIPTGDMVTVYVWVGSDLFSSGTELDIELQKPDQFELRKTLELN